MKKKILTIAVLFAVFTMSSCKENILTDDDNMKNGTQLQGGGELSELAVMLTLKSSFSFDYLLLEDPIIKDLLVKYASNDIEFYPSCPGAVDKELLYYYTLRATDNKETILQAFLATGYFESEYHVFEVAETCMMFHTNLSTICVNSIASELWNDDKSRWRL